MVHLKNWVSRSVKTVHTNSFVNNLINLQLPILILKKKSIISDIHHHVTYMYIHFQQIRVSGSVKTVLTLTNIFANNRKMHKFATTNSNFEEKQQLIQTCGIVKRACISIFSKLGLVDQSKPFTLMYLQKMASYIDLQLPKVILKKQLF